MNKYAPLINAAYRTIDNAKVLLDNENTPFGAMYKQYKTLDSFWKRMCEEAADSNSGRLEEVCVDLELTLDECKAFLDAHAPKKSESAPDTVSETTTENN